MKQINKNVKVCAALVAALLSLSANGHAFNEKDAAAKWNSVKGSRSESSFLINLFLTEDMPGEFPHRVRARLREIATANDAELLLKMLIDPSKKEQHISAYTLLKECKGDDHVALLEHYFGITDNRDVRNELFNLITERNSPAAFASATRIIDDLYTRGQHDEAIGFLDYMVRFNNHEIRQDVISGVSSSSEIIKAASYVALRNYPDEEVEAIVNNAMVSEHTEVEGEEKFQSARSGSIQSSDEAGAFRAATKSKVI